MTDKVLDKEAEEYVRTLRVAGINFYNHCDIERAYKCGFKRGSKSQWHDLLENPNDLPPEKDVIIKCSNTYGDNHKVITDEGSLRYFIGGRYYWEPDEDECYPAGYYWYNSTTDECLDDTGYTVVGWKEF